MLFVPVEGPTHHEHRMARRRPAALRHGALADSCSHGAVGERLALLRVVPDRGRRSDQRTHTGATHRDPWYNDSRSAPSGRRTLGLSNVGSYAQCWLGGLYVGWSKNDVDHGILQFFDARDSLGSSGSDGSTTLPFPGRIPPDPIRGSCRFVDSSCGRDQERAVAHEQNVTALGRCGACAEQRSDRVGDPPPGGGSRERAFRRELQA